MLSDDDIDRYARHLVLREIGGQGQMRLQKARVALVGLGGIGAPASLYLAAAGVGVMGLIDDDVVSLSNLQRQILYATQDIGRPKLAAGIERLSGLNSAVDYRPYAVRLDEGNAKVVLSDFDMVIDGSDNFETRFVVNRACQALKIPLISAALGRWSGHISVFDGSPCYQCLVPEIPPEAETCERAGVVGALAGIIGSIAALEAIKLITGAGEPLRGRLLIYESLTGMSRTISLRPDATCPVCASPLI
jgi:molybdopterin-synthase adenylyltransferase